MPLRQLRYAAAADYAAIAAWLDGRRDPGSGVEAKVREILDRVKKEGDAALAEYTRRFDCPNITASRLRVKKGLAAKALAAIPKGDAAILAEAIANVTAFHERQRENSWLTTQADGTILGQVVQPVDRVGLYVPGGQGGETPLVSSLIMNAVPARVAGVREIAVCSPPRKDGSLNPYILATAALLCIDEIFLCGSAWAIAAMAYGTKAIRACDVIAGPGNIWVATAKALLTGRVGIDMVAGPSEIAVVADDSAHADCIAADMLSQAEHDPLAATLLVTPSPRLAKAATAELKAQLGRLPRAEIAKKALADWSAVVLTPDLDAALDFVNRLAPEHLELAVNDPWSLVPKVRHAGAMFLGHHCPEPVGDYFAGPNHVLPTLGTARFSSALSVQTFCKRTSIVATSAAYVKQHGAKIARLARLEGLEAHARSVECRLKKK